MRRPQQLLALVVLAGLAACSMPYKTPEFASNTTSVDFDGIASRLNGDRPLDLIMVHGMCTHDGKWAEEAVQGIYASLGEDPAKVSLREHPVEGTSVLLYQQTLQTKHGALRANAIVWSPLTTPLKGQLCYDQTDKSPTCPPEEAKKTYPYKRATLNRILKDTILNDCLSDAVIYQGKARDEINAQMQRALLQAVATSGGDARASGTAETVAAVPQQLPLIVITESLGSKVTFDALLKLSQTKGMEAAGTNTWNRITQIFMGANQLPILALGDQRLDGSIAEFRADSGYPEDPIAALFKGSTLSLLNDGHGAPQVVAFTDPNDLLSYVLSPSSNATAYPVVDVVLSNDKTYLGLAELPTTAHLGYRTNPEVQRLIACGKSRKGCP
ncbi:hypothetical protein ALDI51_31550 [Alicycliphilus denitrificans]|uniref:hypothetical protein n=1 Tax=Alicycliphilus denitrificans TaxID=179636 RepID=UPI001916914A|nr:hypothetical protein [Alicycliphilus denitrificans]BCN39836.1 hypothetical protein ALDI51_31550 [Alicycliphilus denitrificans]